MESVRGEQAGGGVADFNGATAFEPWNQGGVQGLLHVHATSMGPRHLSRGIGQTNLPAHPALSHFNGATAFEPWNRGNEMQYALGSVGLQWGHGI